MVRQFLLLAGVAMSASVFAAGENANSQQAPVKMDKSVRLYDPQPKIGVLNDGSYDVPVRKKATDTNVIWKRPAGQFWGTGYSPENGWYYLTPLVLRPWVEYTFENISKAKGSHTWTMQVYDPQTNDYNVETSTEESVTASYLRYEDCALPRLSYKGQITYPTSYSKKTPVQDPFSEITLVANESISSQYPFNMVVSSHFWGLFTRQPVDYPLGFYSGADAYPGMESGMWFGTNASGFNAMATRFEKPMQPYLLNGVYWYYTAGQAIPKDIPLKAYVFKTVNDAKVFTTQSGKELEIAELGELIATADSFVPASDSEDGTEGSVKFEFFEVNPVTGAKNAISLEIEDDITIVVTGFDADLGNGGFITSLMSNDEFDEGHGNLGFLGSLEESEDGTIDYSLTALKNFFVDPMPNTVFGILADVSYPWIKDFELGDVAEVKLPNEGNTTETFQGLQYQLGLLSTSTTDDLEITYNGEDECDWLSVIDVLDDYETTEEGEEVYTGQCALLFQADANPEDVSRTCVVKITIPAASYEITFLQGSDNNAVEIVGAEGSATYFDLAGRRVMNPDKGVYIKVNGDKAEKVVF